MSCSTVVNFSTRHEPQEMPLESLQAEAWIWWMWIQTYPNAFNRICFANFSSCGPLRFDFFWKHGDEFGQRTRHEFQDETMVESKCFWPEFSAASCADKKTKKSNPLSAIIKSWPWRAERICWKSSKQMIWALDSSSRCWCEMSWWRQVVQLCA